MQARLRNKRSSRALLFPVYWLDWGKELDLWLQIVNYADCREGDHRTLAGPWLSLAQPSRPRQAAGCPCERSRSR